MIKELTLTAATVAGLCATTLSAQAATAVEIGVLTCDLESNTNALVVSNAEYNCVLESAGDRIADGRYTAQIRMVGVALNFKSDEKLAWGVLALTDDTSEKPIEGSYIGASANVAVGLGVGSHVLVGGFDNSFGLQPISVTGQRGFGVALGVERLRLNYVGGL